jgi:Gram-negative porin
MTRGQRSSVRSRPRSRVRVRVRVSVPSAGGLAVCATLLLAASAARAEIPLVQYDGWRLSTDGRVNSFLSVAEGQGLPAGQPEYPGGAAGTADIATSTGDLHSTRIRNGFLMSILGFTGQKEVSPDFKVTTRVALWMNITGSRTKNNIGQVDPRELYGKIEGRWGSLLGGSHLSLFGRGGILVDADIAHDYGLGYPCAIKDASGGACGMAGFGAPFPGFDPGFVYATPSLGGLQVSAGIYDPAVIENANLSRAPLPRVEGEVKFDLKQSLRLFASGFWQVLEGTPAGGTVNLHVNAWGAQAGGMVTFGPIMLGGAGFEGAGFAPINYLEEGVLAADSNGVLRDAKGGFGLAAVTIDALRLKIAGGAGVWHLDKTKSDPPEPTRTLVSNPALIKQNLGITVGLYQTTGPVHFALEYFRAEHTWYDRGVAELSNPTIVDVVTPKQVVNFVNVGMTIAW